MDILKIVLMIIFVIDCIALSAIILLQEGKSAGLGTISGAADSYWGQNKGRSMEGALVKSTKFLAILFIVLAAVLNLTGQQDALPVVYVIYLPVYVVWMLVRAQRYDHNKQ